MKVGYLQYDVKHNREENFEIIEKYLEKADCDIVLLPELSLCGYLFKSREELEKAAEEVPSGFSVMRMMKLSEKYGCAIIFGMAEKIGERVFNTAVIVENGSYVGKYQKIHLSDFEKRFFERGTVNSVFEVKGVKIGVEICFDLWFPEISREQIRMGADILFALANFGGETTCGIAKTRAIESLTPLIMCNRIGSEKLPDMDADFLGRSVILSSSGELLSVEKSHCEVFDSVNIEVGKRRANVICGDFESEINFHYKY